MKRLTLTRTGVLLLLAAMSLLLAACEQKTINQILAEPNRYANRDVGVLGTVVQSYSVLGRGAYQIEDGTGKLLVISDKGVPRKGARVGVKGKIKDGFDLGGLIKLPAGIGTGLVMIESSHRAKDDRN